MSADRQMTFRAARPDPAARLAEIKAHRHPVALLLDGLDDARNLGVIFRLAEAARLEHVYLHRLPAYHLSDGQLSKKIGKISREAVRYVPFTVLPDWESTAALSEHYQPVALEWTERSIPYTEFVPGERTLLVLGSEAYGMSDEVLAWTDAQIHLPMYGLNTSMNVACAASIATYDLLRQLTAR